MLVLLAAVWKRGCSGKVIVEVGDGPDAWLSCCSLDRSQEDVGLE